MKLLDLVTPAVLGINVIKSGQLSSVSANSCSHFLFPIRSGLSGTNPNIFTHTFQLYAHDIISHIKVGSHWMRIVL